MAERRRRPTSTIPFGFKLDEDPKYLVEDEKHQQVLAKVKELAAQLSLRKLSEYILMSTGRLMTPRGIQKLIKRKY